MRIENEMLSRFKGYADNEGTKDLSEELDFFFDNVMDTVVDFFIEKEAVG